MDLPLADMWIFAAVARYGSVTGAARTLEIPKSTVSRRLAALEEWLGVRILSRSSRSLTLTDAGQAFLEHCLRLSEVAEDASAFAQEVAGQPRGTLRVTMPPGFGEPLLAPAIARFTQRNPALTVEIDESPRFVDLVAERFDLAFRSGALPDSTLVSQRLSVLETGLFASPDYLSRNPAPRDPSDLA
ncbi:MAG TPA: LysR substrate-binding domain-containing protein, partial [Myxococcaceae bacterium]|nr:LysR substrate-binding domain-containing protein [Myxococcaceae bacterium]